MYEKAECATQDSSEFLLQKENKILKAELEIARKLLQAKQEPQQSVHDPVPASFSSDVFKTDFNRGIEVVFSTIKFLNALNWEARHLLISMFKNL